MDYRNPPPHKKLKSNDGQGVPTATSSSYPGTLMTPSSSTQNATVEEASGSGVPMEIDESLYSRQLYVLGHDAMRRMASSDVLISGLGGLGVEVAKNLILGGVKSVTLHDTKSCTMEDLSSQFYLSEADVGRCRSEACFERLAELNSYVTTRVSTSSLTDDYVKTFSVVVVTDSSLTEQLRISAVTHEYNIPLVIASTKGLVGQIFCDFGDNFMVIDENGEEPVSAVISDISDEGVVTCAEGTCHGLQDGDFVTFSGVEGMTELNECEPKQVRVIGPDAFTIGDTTAFFNYIRGGVATQVKKPKYISFKPLSAALDEPEFVITDFRKSDILREWHLAFMALHRYEERHGRKPRPWNSADAEQFLNDVNAIVAERGEILSGEQSRYYETFCKTSSGNLCPMNAVVGGIVAQEVMKACSGKFTPIHQWLYFDAIECLPNVDEPQESNFRPTNCRYDGQVSVFGSNFQNVLASLNYFVVGAGAIGCELMKNFATMGVGTGEGGKIVVTDNDLIERSNLNRQFLFRPHDVRKPKSTTAAEAIKMMNPDINIVAHEIRVGIDTESVYNDDFFEGLDGVANALDNVEARHYMDQRCIHFRKPLLESGTQGTKGNTQVVVPFKSESYSSSHDPPDQYYPMCTIKTFPNRIEHTLQWARDEFERLFYEPAHYAKQYLDDPYFIENTVSIVGETEPVAILASVKQALIEDRPNSFSDCVRWARYHWQDQYSNKIMQLLVSHPPDSLTTSGTLFWSGHKKCPSPLQFSVEDPLHLDYIFAAANLRAQTYGLPQNRNREDIAILVGDVEVSVFEPDVNAPVPADDDDVSRDSLFADSSIGSFNDFSSISSDVSIASDDIVDSPIDDDESGIGDLTVAQVLGELPPRCAFQDVNISPLEFEKDDDTNLHMDFIVAASNLRAVSYGISPADRLTSKLIAGKIIPAIATTTSVVAGLASLELYKLAQGFTDLDRFKNGFVNLALPFFAFSEPLPAPRLNEEGKEWTIWDRFDVVGELTLQEFIEYFRKEHCLDVVLVSHGMASLYCSYNPKRDRMLMPISQIIQLVTKKPIESHVKSLILEIICNEVNGEDIDVPPVRYTLPLNCPFQQRN